jgi:hypothetical protein
MAVRQAQGPALGHELGPNGVTPKDTIILHIMKQPHEQCIHSDGHSLCLPVLSLSKRSTERCPLWGRLRAQASPTYPL